MRVSLEATCFTPQQLPPEECPEVVIAGRSNVGKSSLINAFLGIRLAHVGATPGKTRSINFYRVEEDERPFRLVDLPGYGYASRSKAEKDAWLRLISAYVEGRAALRLVCHLVDFRHGLLANDLELQEWLLVAVRTFWWSLRRQTSWREDGGRTWSDSTSPRGSTPLTSLS